MRQSVWLTTIELKINLKPSLDGFNQLTKTDEKVWNKSVRNTTPFSWMGDRIWKVAKKYKYNMHMKMWLLCYHPSREERRAMGDDDRRKRTKMATQGNWQDDLRTKWRDRHWTITEKGMYTRYIYNTPHRIGAMVISYVPKKNTDWSNAELATVERM